MVETTQAYWDCECDYEQGYIWPKSLTHCPRCGACAPDQPDARLEEVEDHVKKGKINTHNDVSDNR